MSALTSVYRFYRDGFAAMRLGRTLWILIAVKLILFFGIMKVLFFSDTLQSRFETDEARQEFVSTRLTTAP